MTAVRIVTVDYSSYESVDEEEQEQETLKEQKSRTKPKPPAIKKSLNEKAGDMSVSDTDGVGQIEARGTKKAEAKKVAPKKQPLKATASKDRLTNGSQKSLASFFGPGGTKAKK